MRYKVLLKKQALKDLARLKQVGLAEKALEMGKAMEANPFQPPYEKLTGNLTGKYSRRINIQHRMVYTVDDEKREVHILRMWTHYE